MVFKFNEFIIEKYNQQLSYKYRVYVKTKGVYRIEEMIDGKWVEQHTEDNITKLLLSDCMLHVDEAGRVATISNSFESSEDVPVHAWIECNSYEINGSLSDVDGILYYRPTHVKKFVDRESHEDGNAITINKCNKIEADDTVLKYKGKTDYINDKNVTIEVAMNESIYIDCTYSMYN